MDFKTRPINQDKTQKAVIAGGLIIIVILLYAIYILIKSLDFSGIIFSFGKSLRVDENGHTNILLAGIGGEGHDGGELTDSLIVASIDYNQKIVPMLSVPRDLYVKSQKLNAGERINAVYSVGKNQFSSKEGLEELKQVVSNVTGAPIDYYIKIDFKGFKKIVDSLGGIDVVVEKDLYDPYYPLGETVQYQTFAISAGPHHLDGETALKYARSRETTSDFDRAHRQQQILTAVREKALSLDVLTDPTKIKAIYDSVASSIETDLSLNEIIELAKTAKDFGKESTISRVLTNDMNATCGALLYQPAKDLFGGAFVLLPAGNTYDYIQQFATNFFKDGKKAEDQSAIQVLNGTKIPNLATDVLNYFNRMCYNGIFSGNASSTNLATTTIYYQPGPNGEKPLALDAVTKILPYKVQSGIPPSYLVNVGKIDRQSTRIVIELGADYLDKRIKDPFKLIPYTPSPTPASTTSETTQATTQAKPTTTPASTTPSTPKK